MTFARSELNRKVAFDFLTTPAERIELSVCESIAQPVKLRFVGIQETPWGPERLWNIDTKGHPYYQSTRTLEGLKELGIV